MTMKPLDVSAKVEDYISGPTGNQVARTNGGTNRSGGVSVVEATESTVTQTAETPAAGESTDAPAAAAQ